MTPSLTTTIIVLKTVTLLLGGAVTFYAYRTYRSTGSSTIRTLAIGFGIVTIGALFAGIVDRLLPVDPGLALVVESLFTIVGFGVILYTLHVKG